MTPSSQFVWDYFPLLRLTLYPWRLLSMTAVTTAVLTALSMRLLLQRTMEEYGSYFSSMFMNGAGFLLTALIVVSAIPWLFPPRQSMPEEITAEFALSQELPPFFIGTTTLGEFLPIQVTDLPAPLPNDAELRAGNNPDRLQAADGLSWTQLDGNPIEAHYEVVAERPLTAVYRQFYFPGWQVWVDGEAVPITPSDPDGLITFTVPEGTHTIKIAFTNSWSRWLGWAISFVALTITVILSLYAIRNPQHEPLTTESSLLTPKSLIIFAITAVLIWLFFSFVETPLRHNTLLADGILGKPNITPLDYAGEVRLLSYEAPEQSVPADVEIPLTLYFQALREIGVPYQIGVQVLDGNGLNWMADNTRPFDWRFIADEPWPLDAYRMEPFLITLFDGTPPGTYRFHVGLVRTDTGQTVAAYDLGELFVRTPAAGEKPLEEGMEAPIGTTAVSDNLQLLGTRLDRQEAAPGDPMRVTGLWQALAPDALNEFMIQLVSAEGDVLLEPGRNHCSPLSTRTVVGRRSFTQRNGVPFTSIHARRSPYLANFVGGCAC